LRQVRQRRTCLKVDFVFLASNSYYENDFGVSSTFGAGNTKIVFLKAHLRWAFKKNDLYETDFVLLASTILKEQNLSHIELLVANIIYPLK
jgi:hypothetical protein